jgi:metal-responsive CopG/Arc/MetJ family transcriptional regulator
VNDKAVKVRVKFTEQQLVLVDQILAERKLGQTREEVIASMFRQYVRQTIGAVR